MTSLCPCVELRMALPLLWAYSETMRRNSKNCALTAFSTATPLLNIRLVFRMILDILALSARPLVCYEGSHSVRSHGLVAMSLQDSGRSGSEDMEFDDEDELDFCILTPQQALGALVSDYFRHVSAVHILSAASKRDCYVVGTCLILQGEHAPQYAKIFVNGSTFVADKSEPGMVIVLTDRRILSRRSIEI